MINSWRSLSFQLLIWIGLMISMTDIQAVDEAANDLQRITQASLDYIESQHKLEPKIMARAIHRKLAKRTFWKSVEGDEFVLETSYETMLRVAATYNEKGDKFPPEPKKELRILDVDERVASVKLIADDWVDYLHLIKNDNGQWKIINVLWRYNDSTKHRSQN